MNFILSASATTSHIYGIALAFLLIFLLFGDKFSLWFLLGW
jgi:hypothetical protein